MLDLLKQLEVPLLYDQLYLRPNVVPWFPKLCYQQSSPVLHKLLGNILFHYFYLKEFYCKAFQIYS